MLLRGQNLLGYRHYSDDVVEAFVQKAARNGVDVFRIFDAMNDLRNLEVSIKTVLKAGKHAQGAICYTTSPVHTVEHFVEQTKALEKLGCHSIVIKDMAGLLTPARPIELFSALSKAVKLPLAFHSHATVGVANICMYLAVEHGARHVDTAISSLSWGTSHSPTESMVVAFRNTPHDTGLDLGLLQEIGFYFREVRKKYRQFERVRRDRHARAGEPGARRHDFQPVEPAQGTGRAQPHERSAGRDSQGARGPGIPAVGDTHVANCRHPGGTERAHRQALQEHHE